MKRAKEKLFLTVDFGFAALLLVAYLLISVRITAMSDSVSQLEKRFEALQTENAILTAKYESGLNLGEIERRATEELGMQRCEPEQIVIIYGEP